MEKLYWVYILASQHDGTLYTGVTNDLARRVFEHRMGAIPGFTARHGVKRLVWYEAYSSIVEAIAQEKLPQSTDIFSVIPDGPKGRAETQRPALPGSRLLASLRPG
jgi:predicted GIY-YIG superfamily endonuclease